MKKFPFTKKINMKKFQFTKKIHMNKSFLVQKFSECKFIIYLYS